MYSWTVRDRLPTIPIPLKAPDPDVPLDLDAVFAVTYNSGRYERALNYADPPVAPLRSDDLAWALEQAQRTPG